MKQTELVAGNGALATGPTFARGHQRILGMMLVSVAALALATSPATTDTSSRALALPHDPGSQVAVSLPVSLAPTVSARIGASERGFWPVRHGASLLARGGGIRDTFTSAGVLLRDGNKDTLALSLAAVGRGGHLDPVGAVAPTGAANEVRYHHESISEFFRNGPYGLEQGFIVRHRPQAGTRALVLALRVGGPMVPEQIGSEIIFRAHPGATALRYGQLSAIDATGRRLPAHMQVSKGTIQLLIDDRHARYPLRIDPFIQQGEKLTGSGEIGKSDFGDSVALSSDGDTALIGAPGSGRPFSNEGQVWVYTRSGSTWIQQAELRGSGEMGWEGEPFPAPGAAGFGAAVAISSDGNTAVVGGPYNYEAEGAVWVFTRSGSTWTQQAELRGVDIIDGYFGDSVALSSDGNTAVISDEDLPVVFAFTRSGSTWSSRSLDLEGEMFPTDLEAVAEGPVALSGGGTTALVGVDTRPRNCCGDERTLAVDVFTRSGETWTKQTELPDAGAVALSYDGNTALIGNHVFTRSGETWTQRAELPGTGAVALSYDGNTALIGNDIFTHSGETWTQRSELTGSGESDESDFGSAVALSADSNTALIGGPGDEGKLGAAWVFVREPPIVATGQPSFVTQTSVTLSATVNPNGETVSECRFEYGPTTTYGASAPCSSLPGSGAGSVEVSAPVANLSPNSTYHYRIAATNPGGASYGADRKLTTLGPPDFGRCVKVPAEKRGTKTVYHGGFSVGTCIVTSPTKAGKYEWYPGLLRTSFSMTLKEGVATFATVKKVKVTCRGESGSGEYSGIKEVANVVIKLTGCESLGKKCTTPSLAEGELETKTLEGALGWEDRAAKRPAFDLFPVGKAGALMEYRCIGAVPITLSGSVLVPIKADKMLSTVTLGYRASKGRQKPEDLEGEPADVLTASLNGEVLEQMSLTATLTLVNEEAVEINAVA